MLTDEELIDLWMSAPNESTFGALVGHYARAVEQAAYAAAIKACEASAEHEEEARALQRADAARGGDENEELARLRHLSDVRLFNAGISTCAEAIRALMQEQSK
ncbi:MAG: hypothetical protein WDA07_06335 [Leucobacter sp.]